MPDRRVDVELAGGFLLSFVLRDRVSDCSSTDCRERGRYDGYCCVTVLGVYVYLGSISVDFALFRMLCVSFGSAAGVDFALVILRKF